MSDLISRVLILKELERIAEIHPYRVIGDRDSYSPYNEAWEDCISLIEERLQFLPSAKPEQRWIPVSEALPEDMDRLLATIVRSDGSKRVRSGHYYKGLFSMDNGDVWNETDKEILAWMPLVEPYGGEE